MALIWYSGDPKPSDSNEGLWIYNGFDCMLTLEVCNVLLPKLNEVTQQTYDFARDLQAPVLFMQAHGVLVDKPRRNEVAEILRAKLAGVRSSLDEILEQGLGIYGLNPASPDQLKDLFYNKLGGT